MKKLSLSIMFLYVGLTIISMYQGNNDLALYRGNTSILWFIIYTLSLTIEKKDGMLKDLFAMFDKAMKEVEKEMSNNKKKK